MFTLMVSNQGGLGQAKVVLGDAIKGDATKRKCVFRSRERNHIWGACPTVTRTMPYI